MNDSVHPALHSSKQQLGVLTAAASAFYLVVRGNLRGRAGFALALSSALLALAAGILEIIMRLVFINRRRSADTQQIQALLGLYAELNPPFALPELGGYAIHPKTALEYARIIRQLEPETVVDLGSGASTLIASHLLQQRGAGRVIATDHDKGWGEKTRALLRQHGLLERAEVRHAPLTFLQHEDGDSAWYDENAFADVDRIDMLFVDGPPDPVDDGQRRPGLTRLADRFGEDTVVIIDDTHRPGWRRWVHTWAAEQGFTVEEIPMLQHGSLLLYKPGSRVDRLRHGA